MTDKEEKLEKERLELNEKIHNVIDREKIFKYELDAETGSFYFFIEERLYGFKRIFIPGVEEPIEYFYQFPYSEVLYVLKPPFKGRLVFYSLPDYTVLNNTDLLCCVLEIPMLKRRRREKKRKRKR